MSQEGDSLDDIAPRYGFNYDEDGLWYKFPDEPGKTNQEMWEYIWDAEENAEGLGLND